MLTFNSPEENAFLKTLWENEKMLVTSIFFYSHNVFNFIKDKNHYFGKFSFVFCKCIQFGLAVTLTKKQNFRTVQICRLQLEGDLIGKLYSR